MSGPNSQMGKRIAADLEALGWRVVKAKHSHFKAYCPCGVHMIVIASSTSDIRATKNTAAQVKRFLRDCPATPSS